MKWLRTGCLVVSCLALIAAATGCSEVAAPSDSLPGEEQPLPSRLAIEQEIFDLINEARVGSGLQPLTRDATIDALAWQHSQDMDAANHLSHDGFQTRANEIMRELGASRVGENVAVGYSSAQAFVDGWLASEGHRDNIMDRSFSRTGIGYFEGYATQIFCD